MRFPTWRKRHVERLVQAHAANVSAHRLLERSGWPARGSVLACIDLCDEVVTELFNFVEASVEVLNRAKTGPVTATAPLEHITQPQLEQNPDPKPPEEEH